jgi:uncharacterized protein (TIGR00369 family)
MISEDTRQFVAVAMAAQSPLVGWDVRLETLEAGIVRLSMPITPAITTYTGAVVSGVIATVADVVAGLALITTLTPPRPVITLDFTSQHLSPAIGTRLFAVGRAERTGKSLGFASAEAFVVSNDSDDQEKRVSRLSATFSILS